MIGTMILFIKQGEWGREVNTEKNTIKQKIRPSGPVTQGRGGCERGPGGLQAGKNLHPPFCSRS